MIVKTQYNVQTGEITEVRFSSYKNEALGFPEVEGHLYVDGEGDPATQRVVNGVIVDKPQSELDAIELEKAWKLFRKDRNNRLQASDWTQVPDAPVDQAAWAAYRQELRDLPDNITDINNITWPTPPQ